MFLELLLTIKLFSSQPQYLDLKNYPDLKLRVESPPAGGEEPVEINQKPVVKSVVQASTAKSQPVLSGPTDLQPLFSKYAAEYGINEQTLTQIARCESHFNSGAVNGPYAGMYQFTASTWASTRQSMGLDPDPNLRFSAEESIKTTAFKISRGGIGAWPVCGR